MKNKIIFISSIWVLCMISVFWAYAQPSNNLPSGAITLSVLSGDVYTSPEYDNKGAYSYDVYAGQYIVKCGLSKKDVWFKFRLPISGSTNVSIQSQSDFGWAIYSKGTTSDKYLTCSISTPIMVNGDPGDDIFIRVWGVSSATDATGAIDDFKVILDDSSGGNVTPISSQTFSGISFTGGVGSYCDGEKGLSVQMDNSQAGSNYEYLLMRNGVSFGSKKTGTGGAIQWDDLPDGNYTVRGVDTNQGKYVEMNGNAVIKRNSLIDRFGYLYEKKITINGSKVTGDHLDFPLLIHLIDAELKDGVVHSDGFDIVFSDENFMKLDHEIESYNDANGELYAWVRIPSLKAGIDTKLRIFYGNKLVTSDPSSKNTWLSYQGVWHLSDMTDASEFNLDAIDYLSTQVDGVFNSGWGFEGRIDSYLDLQVKPSDYKPHGMFTFSFWYNKKNNGNTTIFDFGDITGDSNYSKWNVELKIQEPKTTLSFNVGDAYTFGSFKKEFNTPTDWIPIHGLYDGSGIKLIISEASKTIVVEENIDLFWGSVNFTNLSTLLQIGKNFDGSIDEVRLSGEIKSEDWIKTEVDNILDPDSFISTSASTRNSVADFEVCYNDITTYNVSNVSGQTYTWSVSGGNIISGQNTSEIDVEWTSSPASIALNQETLAGGCMTHGVNYSIQTDTTPPVADSNTLTDLTQCSVATPTAPTATDNCGATITGTTTSTFPITTQGTTTVIWTYTDSNGNSTTQTQNVIIDDTTPPVADSNTLTDLTQCSVATPTAPTATDNCGATITGTTTSTFPITAQGTTTVIWTYTDSNGNSTTQTQNVIIDDTTPPVADSNTLTDLTGQCSVATPIAPTATDNCGATITGTTTSTFPITAQGTTTVIWTYTDSNGNSTTQTQNVIIDDTTPPVADSNTLTDLTGQCSVATPIAPTATDNCGATITGTTTSTFPITAQGTTTVIWTYTDSNGNSTTQTQNVIIDDTTPPVADSNTLTDLTGQCSVATPTAPTATDNCGTTITGTTTSTFPITAQGTTTVIWTYTDSNGNSTTQTQNVIIDDTTPPVADSNTLTDLTGQCSVATPIAPTATDNCGATITGTTTSTFPITAQGTTTVTWTYTDSKGNSNTQTQNVIIDDTTPPVADSNTLTDLTGQCSVATPTAPTATDNCGATITGTTTSTFPITAQGTTTVIWTYTDSKGNSNTQTQNVIIDDTTPPVADSNTLTDLTGQCSVATPTAPTATDNCGATITGTTTSTFPITAQGTTTVIWTYTDSKGNSNTQTQNVIIDDTTPPVADSNTLTDLTGQCSVATPTAPTATDNCGATITGTTTSTFPITAQGTTTVIWTYTDSKGNSNTQTQNVVIKDITKPVLTSCLSDITINASAGVCSAIATWITPTVTDNCVGSVTLTSSHVSGDTFNSGTTTVTYTATDAVGNTNTCSFDIIIKDNTAPVITNFPQNIVQAADNGSCTAKVSWIEPSAVDDCSNTTIVRSHSPNHTFPAGITTVSYEFRDTSGNIVSYQFEVKVIENNTNPPVATADTFTLNEDEKLTENILTNDTDAENGSLSSRILTDLSKINGDLKFSSSGDFTFQPKLNYNGRIALEYEVCDDGCPFLCSQSDIFIDILPVNDAPIAIDQTIKVSNETTLIIKIEASDVDGDLLSIKDIAINGEAVRVLPTDRMEITIEIDIEIFLNAQLEVVICDNGSPEYCDTSFIELISENRKVIINEGISPNGDAKNDVWLVEGIENFPNNQVSVYSNQGKLIYNTTSYNNTNIVWDGKIKEGINKGKIVKEGEYYYIIQLDKTSRNVLKGFILVNY